jgi:hypothetical protein
VRTTLIAQVLASIVGALALVELAIGKAPLLQVDRETPAAWLRAGRVRWGIYTGAMLGFGGLTRLGFIGWYLVPITVLAARSAIVGAAIWGVYGALRAMSSIALEVVRRVRAGMYPKYIRQTRLLTVGRRHARYATNGIAVTLAAAMWFVA